MRDWRIILGAVFGAVLLLFLMGLVAAAVLGYTVPCNSRTLVVFIMALATALASAFIGGSATVQGHLPGVRLQNFAKQNPTTFTAAGGFAMFVITLLIANAAYGPKGCKERLPPDGVSYNIPAPTRLASAIKFVAKGSERILGCAPETLDKVVRPGPVTGPTDADVIRQLALRLEGADIVELRVTLVEGGIYEIRCV